MKQLKTNPGAKRLMESLRNMGYDCSTAIADLVDNSIAAGASEIYIDIIPKQEARADILPKQESKPAAIVIADNGKGMNRDELQEAMRFGTIQQYSKGDLGKYGLGLKTASLSQCRVLTVSSKERPGMGIRPRRHYMRWDIDHVYATDDWNLLVPDEDELAHWEKDILDNEAIGESGTIILWTGLDGHLSLLSSTDEREREKFLARLIDEVSLHLRMVFHRFMQGSVTGHRKLNIEVCGVPLIPWDPFCRTEETQELDILRIPLTTSGNETKHEKTITISPFILPREDEFSSSVAWKDASGPKGWNQMQGLYFYRNNRLLQAGGWSRLRAPDEHTKLLRIAVDFADEFDTEFAINITKMRASIPAEIRDKFASHVTTWMKIARMRYEKPVHERTLVKELPITTDTKSIVTQSSSSQSLQLSDQANDLTMVEDAASKTETVSIRSQQVISDILPAETTNWDAHKFSEVLLKILEAVYTRKVPVESIPLNLLKKIYQEYL